MDPRDKNVMLDIETMSTRPDALILTIGAVGFDLDALETTGSFYKKVDFQSAVRAGGHIDQATVSWWAHQSPQARIEITGNGGEDLEVCLNDLCKFISGFGPGVMVWSYGTALDIAILRYFLAAFRIDEPWGYRNIRDMRTYCAEHPLEWDDHPELIKHHALHDALAQVRHMFKIARHERARG